MSADGQPEKDAGKAARMLVELGIVAGYEDGSLRLDKTITPAEAAVIFLHLEDITETIYTDSGLSEGTQYEYAVIALKGEFESSFPSAYFPVTIPLESVED